MPHSRLCSLALLGLGLLVSTESIHAATPCVTPTENCTEWVSLGKGASRSTVYRTFSLSTPNPGIRHALIMVHGTNRNADHYFATATSAAFLAQRLQDTEVISPSFRSADPGCADKLESNEVSWSCRGDSWRSGGVATSDKTLTSFDFVDELLHQLANKKIFPNLISVVIAGHSAGGQFVSRYEMANRVHDSLGIQISYIVANPSSYAWPDATRVLPSGDGAPEQAALGWQTEAPHSNFTFGPFDGASAPGYDKWPYGLEQRTSGYTAGITDDQLKKQLASRPTTYVLSQVDTLPLGGFDGSPSAMAQGQ